MIDNVKLATALRLAADALDSEPQEMEAAPVTNVVTLPTAAAMPPQEAAPPAAAGLYRVASGPADAFGDPVLPGHPSLAKATAAAGPVISAPAATPAPEVDPAPLLAKARTLLTAYWQKTGDDAAPADLLARYGAQKATQVPVDRLPALIAELEGLTHG